MNKKYILEINVTINEDNLFPGQNIKDYIAEHLEGAALQVDKIEIKNNI